MLRLIQLLVSIAEHLSTPLANIYIASEWTYLTAARQITPTLNMVGVTAKHTLA